MSNTNEHRLSRFLTDPHYQNYRHILTVLIIFLITSNVFSEESNESVSLIDRFFAWLLYSVSLIGVIYLNTYVLATQFLFKNRILLYFIFVLILGWGVLFIIAFIQGMFYDTGGAEAEMNITKAVLNVLSSTLSIGLLIAGSSTLLLFKHWIVHNQRISELANNTLKSELKLLKSQINPHFLFNMLNNANLLIKKRRKEASEVLFKLEDLLRYQLDDSTKESVSLRSDIHFLNDFLNLEKIRRDQFDFSISEEGDIENTQVPPLLFIPFIENAVKHNPESETYVNVSFSIQKDILEFRCENPKPSQPMIKKETGGLGLRNIKRRLELLYPDSHTLDITDTENTYIVYLTLYL